MAGWLPLAATLPFVAVLLGSGAWASRRYVGFDQLPSHFGITGKADSFAPRRVMSWLLPVLFSLAIVAIGTLSILIPPEMRNGDPVVGTLVGGVSLVGAQIFVLGLTERWARKQRKK